MKYLILILIFFTRLCFGFDYGIGIHPNSTGENPESIVKVLKKYNITSLRVDYRWDQVERVKGIYTPPDSKTEKLINLSIKNGITPLIILGSSNPLYKIKKPMSNNDRRVFLAYTNWVINHFKKQKVIFEVWNEWGLSKPIVDATNDNSTINYFELVKSVFLQKEKIDPGNKLIAGSFNPTKLIELKWAQKLFSMGFCKYIDGVSIHAYNYDEKKPLPAEDNIKDIAINVKNLTRKNNFPIYITEVGIPNSTNIKISKDIIYNYAKSYYTNARKIRNIEGVWWYELHDDGNNPNSSEENFGILDYNYVPKPISLFFKNIK